MTLLLPIKILMDLTFKSPNGNVYNTEADVLKAETQLLINSSVFDNKKVKPSHTG